MNVIIRNIGLYDFLLSYMFRYTMRTEEYRYTEYPVFEYGTTYTPLWKYQDEVCVIRFKKISS